MPKKETLISEKEKIQFGVWRYKLPDPAHLVVSDFDCIEGLERFQTARTYVWSPEDDQWYGGHAHLNSIEFAVCIEGQVQFELENGVDSTTVILEKREALFYRRLVWHKVKRLEPDSTLVVHSNRSYDRENDYLETKKEWKEALWKKVPDHPQIQSLPPRSQNDHVVYVFLHDTKVVPTHWRYVVTKDESFVRQEFQKLKDDDLLLGTGVRGAAPTGHKKRKEKLENILEDL